MVHYTNIKGRYKEIQAEIEIKLRDVARDVHKFNAPGVTDYLVK